MNIYSRARKHIDMNRVKELKEEKDIADLEQQREIVLAEISRLNKQKNKHYDWRTGKNLIKEGMTTASLGMINYPAEGDVDLDNVAVDATSGTPGSGGSDGSYSFGTYDETGNGGFVLYLDTTKYDTIKLNANRGGATSISISVGGGGLQTLSNGTNRITISSANRGKRIQFVFNAFKSGGTGATGASISGVTLQRRTPINLFVPLDHPEANSFIRDGQVDNLSPEEKKKRLEEQLKSSEEYLNKMFGEGMPGTATQIADYNPQQSFMDIRADGERITKQDGRTVTDTTRGIEDGKIDGEPFNTKPIPSSVSKAETKKLSFDDKIKGTWADPEYRGKQIADVKSRAYDPNAPFAKGGVGDPEWMDQQAEKARARARGEIAKNISKPVPNVNDSDKAELEKNIEASLKQLEIDSKELKGDALKRNIGLAVDLGLDIITVVTLLTPIPGDEAAALSAQAAKAGIKTTVSPSKMRELARNFQRQNPGKYNPFRSDVANKLMKQRGVGTQLNPNPNFRKPTQFNSYELKGETIIEKKKFKDLTKKIPGYYDGKPAPLGFPIVEPPKMKDGMHPDLVDGKKTAKRFNRLDPVSAKAMPKTGNSLIDKKVKVAAKKPK